MLRLGDDQWHRIRDHFPEEHLPDSRPGRKPIPARAVLEAVLWILNTGAQWHMLPQCYPNYQTVHRRFQHWCRSEVLRGILVDLANTLRAEGALDVTDCFIDASFAPAKGGGEQIGLTKRSKGVKILAIVDRQGLPLSVSTHAANHHEVTLVQLSFDFYMIEAKPEHLIGDRAYDSDALDADLRTQGIEMIAPHRAIGRSGAPRTGGGGCGEDDGRASESLHPQLDRALRACEHSHDPGAAVVRCSLVPVAGLQRGSVTQGDPGWVVGQQREQPGGDEPQQEDS